MTDAAGHKTQRVLGPAWVKDSGRRTARGATIWRAADGPKPDDGFMTPRDAEDRLRELLAAAPKDGAVRQPRRTFGDACHEWLRYVEHDRQRAPSTVRNYRRVVERYLLPAFGTSTPLRSITTERIDAFREQLLADGRLSRRTIQQALVLLHGILRRAQRRKWIATNPAADAERVAVQRSGDFNILEPAQVEAVARAATSEQDAAVFVVAAYTGLRLGELRALRWREVDFGRAVVMVRSNILHGAPSDGGEKAPKSGHVRSVPLVDQAAAALDRLSRRDHFTGADDLVFPSDVGTYLDDARLRRRFYAAMDRAGLGELRRKPRPFVLHDLRHTFGTLAVRAFPLSDVRAFMGHTDISTTMQYVHHVPQHDAARKLSAILRTNTGADAAIPLDVTSTG